MARSKAEKEVPWLAELERQLKEAGHSVNLEIIPETNELQISFKAPAKDIGTSVTAFAKAMKNVKTVREVLSADCVNSKAYAISFLG